MTPSDAPITVWIERLKAGDEAAAEALWQHYFQPLVRYARQRMQGTPRRMSDEEDVALSVFKSFCAAAAAGRFTQLRDRHDLWTLLLRMTQRKAIDHWRREHRQRRGGGQAPPEPDCELDAFPAPESLPLMFAVLDELLEDLRDETLQAIVVCRLQGYKTGEIAESLGTTRRTIERKLQVVRERWTLAEEQAG